MNYNCLIERMNGLCGRTQGRQSVLKTESVVGPGLRTGVSWVLV